MSDGPSRAEYERLYETMDDGFKGVHARLDLLNGRTGKGEVERAELRQRIRSVEKEIFPHPRGRATDVETRPYLSKREGALVTLGLGVVLAAAKACFVLGEFAIEILKASVKVR